MNPKLHTALRIVFALFLIVSGAKHLYTVYWGDPTIMATGQLEQGIAVCTHDEFTADIPANQVLKSVLMRMARLPGMDSTLASEARRTALRMTEVSLVDPDVRMLGRVRIHRNNRFYGFLLSICRLILDATSVAESRDSLEAAEQQFYGVVEERLFDLFEMFVRNFYTKQLAGGRMDAFWTAPFRMAMGSFDGRRQKFAAAHGNGHHPRASRP